MSGELLGLVVAEAGVDGEIRVAHDMHDPGNLTIETASLLLEGCNRARVTRPHPEVDGGQDDDTDLPNVPTTQGGGSRSRTRQTTQLGL